MWTRGGGQKSENFADVINGSSLRRTRFGPNRVAADIQGNGEDDFLVKIGLWFRMKLRFRMNLWPKLQYI